VGSQDDGAAGGAAVEGPRGEAGGAGALDQVARDLADLGAVSARWAATDGERRMLDAVRARLPEGVSARVEGFVGHPLPLLVLGLHGAFALAGGLVGLRWPLAGLVVVLGVAASLVGEGTGRLGLLRFWMPRLPSYNLVATPRAGGTVASLPRGDRGAPIVEEALSSGEIGAIVLSTPLDMPRWRARRRRGLRRPLQAVAVSMASLGGLLLLRALSEPFGAALAGLYASALVVMAGTGGLFFIARRAPVGASSEASGVAVLLELVRRLRDRPLEGVQTWVVFTGCGHAHQDGMTAFLQLRGERMPRPVLVLSLDDAGRPPLSAAVTEGPLWAQVHRPTGPALVERLRWAGVRIPEVDRADPTDARAAMILGYRALALTGGSGEATPESVLRAADVIETLLRWHREDLARVGRASVGRSSVAASDAVEDRAHAGGGGGGVVAHEKVAAGQDVEVKPV
jgi:hypothetical protein